MPLNPTTILFLFLSVYSFAQGQSSEAVEDSVYAKPEVEAQFPGGMQAKLQFLKQHLQYPRKAVMNETVGKVEMEFIVEKDGSLTHLKVINSVPNGCDEEVMRLIQLMPRWEPALVNNRPVRSLQTFPVKFQLAKK